jgi:hypothetical protein
MMKKALLLTCAFIIYQNAIAQRPRGERGILRGGDITPTKKEIEKQKEKNGVKTKKEDDEFSFEEEPKLRFSSEFEPTRPADVPAPKIEPIKEVNTTVQDDTSSIDEGFVQVVEIEELAQFAGSEDMVKIASHFSVWDPRHKDPYGIDAKDFEDVIPIQLYE